MKKAKRDIFLKFITISVLSLFVILQGCDLNEVFSDEDYLSKIENVELTEEMISQINDLFSTLASKESEVIDECSCLDAIFGESYRKAFNDNGIYYKEVAVIDNNKFVDIDLDLNRYSLLLFRVIMPDTGFRINSINLLKNRIEKSYYLNVDLENLGAGFGVISPLYYWQVYDKLDSSYEYVTIVNIIKTF